MADAKAIANRIKSVEDTKKITNAMYLISSTKLRKARKKLEDTKPFFAAMREEIGRIIVNTHVKGSRYLVDTENKKHESGTCGILVITADKGLAGAYNQNVIKETLKMIKEFPDHRLFVIGEYGRHYFASHNIEYETDFNITDDEPTLWWARMIAGYVMELFDKGEISQVYFITTVFKNNITTEIIRSRLVPFEESHFTEKGALSEAEVEFEYVPSPSVVMDKCIPVYCIGIIYSILVSAWCCEQNDRMMAMDSANQNADKLLEELNLKYNHLRQSSITQEITEISASVRAAAKSKK